MSMFLTDAQVAQIREALVVALEHHGGDLEEEDEPGVSDATRAFEAKMRAAIQLLDQAGAPS